MPTNRAICDFMLCFNRAGHHSLKALEFSQNHAVAFVSAGLFIAIANLHWYFSKLNLLKMTDLDMKTTPITTTECNHHNYSGLS